MSESHTYDWNTHDPLFKPKVILLNDETLRDGLQSPSTTDPPIEQKVDLLRLMETLGINSADIGYPSASDKMYDDVKTLATLILDEDLSILPNCAARTHAYDINPIIEISRDVGIPIEVCTFLGSSPVRQLVEQWSFEKLEELTRDAVSLCVENDVPVMFVTEDTTRAEPEVLKKLYLAAVHEGAGAICIADTVGHATPQGTHSLVKYIREFLKDEGHGKVRIDWHGHRDRGLSVANSIAALQAGADRIHATGLGIGERCGNTPMDQLMVNLKLMGWIDQDLTRLNEYTKLVSDMVNIPIPVNYPVIGDDAFRTATGVHAAAIIKAQKKGISWADTVYSSIPARQFGRKQEIEIGPLSGKSNVLFKLKSMKLEFGEQEIDGLLDLAKTLGRMITEDEIREFINKSIELTP